MYPGSRPHVAIRSHRIVFADGFLNRSPKREFRVGASFDSYVGTVQYAISPVPLAPQVALPGSQSIISMTQN